MVFLVLISTPAFLHHLSYDYSLPPLESQKLRHLVCGLFVDLVGKDVEFLDEVSELLTAVHKDLHMSCSLLVS